MPRRRALRAALLVVATLLVVALVAVATLSVVLVRRPLPTVDGEVTVPGLSSDVTVLRDAQGVPSITADDPLDLFRAQGYVQAQDRFFEMDYRRHVTAGRLSELVGENETALDADKVTRTLGWRRVAEQEWDLLSDSTRDHLQAYADGVNAYLEDRDPSEIAVEYTVLGLQVEVEDPEPWEPVDSLAWLKAMAWDLRSNYDQELDRALTYASVQDVARVEQLFPAYPQDLHAPILDAATLSSGVEPTAATTATSLGDGATDVVWQASLQSARGALDAVPHLLGDGDAVGSNSWVVSGAHTASGSPMLANDPHLSVSSPGTWTQVGLHCRQVGDDCPFDVAGFSFAGFPGVIIGHNDQLAWGLTNLGADVTDFFLERVVDDQVLVDGERHPVTRRTETIKVNGADDVQLDVVETSHGPIVSDVLDVADLTRVPVPPDAPLGRYAVALSWTALTPGRTADAVFALDTAHSASDVAAAAEVFEVPSQNIVYATVDGHIGYQAPGRIPVRAQVEGPVPSDGTWPRPGWDSDYDWQGYVEAADMPAAQDPPEGFIVAANQAVTAAGTGPELTSDWDYGYRSQRIRDSLAALISAGTPIDGDAMSAVQNDVRDPLADVLVDHLLTIDIGSGFDADGQDLLRTWDRNADADSPAAVYLAAVWRTLLDRTFKDDLPAGMAPSGGSRWLEVVRGLLEQPDAAWWDDRSTVAVVEGRDEMLGQALVSARRELTVELGRNPAKWQWGRLHTVDARHPVLGGDDVPALVRRLVNPGPVSVPGGTSIVNAMAWDAGSGSFAVTSAPSMRMVVDLGDLDASTWVAQTGVSGHPASVHYDDQLGPWSRGETFAWPFSAEAVEDASRDELRLVPDRG